eukprot:4884-Heterococcus_DN1.PRE.1
MASVVHAGTDAAADVALTWHYQGHVLQLVLALASEQPLKRSAREVCAEPCPSLPLAAAPQHCSHCVHIRIA